MYHTLLGADGFRQGMDLYFERHDGQAVTCDDFRAAMADANGADLEQFERWYSQAGTPLVEASGEWDAERAVPPDAAPVVPRDRYATTPRAAAAHAGRVGLLDSATGADAAAASRRRRVGRDADAPGARAARGRAALRVPGRRRAPRGLAAARLLGSRPLALRARTRRARLPDGARQRRLQPLGGGSTLRDRRAAAHGQRHRDRRTARPR